MPTRTPGKLIALLTTVIEIGICAHRRVTTGTLLPS